jgi:hypothetical protein
MSVYQHDIAFSLLDTDGDVASQLADLLRPLNVFLYFERQLELSGADGMNVFAAAFKRDSRTIAILYRAGWGKTKWTRAEEDMIRDRVLNDGADVVTLVNLDGSPPPDWFPATRIWADYKKLGLMGVAAVLKERVQHRGKVVREETAEEMAAALTAKRRAMAERQAFLDSEQGADAARREADVVLKSLADLAPKIGATLLTEPSRNAAMLQSEDYSITVAWAATYVNSTRDARLVVVEWEGGPPIAGHRFVTERELAVHRFIYDRPRPGEVLWRDERGRPVGTSDRLADECAKYLLKRIEQERRR